jgi:hypothetical protein
VNRRREPVKTRESRGGELKTLVHSRPAALVFDPLEKKAFFRVSPRASALRLGTGSRRETGSNPAGAI